MGQDKCIVTTFLGEPCPYDATIGDYCIIHAGGWDHFKANSAMLYNVYGQMTTIVHIVTGLVTILGTGKIFSVISNGEKRSLNLDQMRDTAETVMRSLEIMTDLDDPRREIESMGATIIRLHEDVILLIQHIALNAKKTAQVSTEKLAGAD